MSDKPKYPIDRDRLVLFGAVAASMSIVVGLWLLLLPGELDLSRQASQGSPIWKQLRDDGQAAIDKWQQSVDQVRGKLNDLPASQKLQAAAAADSIKQEELDRFRTKLEAVTEEKENPNQHDSQEETAE